MWILFDTYHMTKLFNTLFILCYIQFRILCFTRNIDLHIILIFPYGVYWGKLIKVHGHHSWFQVQLQPSNATSTLLYWPGFWFYRGNKVTITITSNVNGDSNGEKYSQKWWKKRQENSNWQWIRNQNCNQRCNKMCKKRINCQKRSKEERSWTYNSEQWRYCKWCRWETWWQWKTMKLNQ